MPYCLSNRWLKRVPEGFRPRLAILWRWWVGEILRLQPQNPLFHREASGLVRWALRSLPSTQPRTRRTVEHPCVQRTGRRLSPLPLP